MSTSVRWLFCGVAHLGLDFFKKTFYSHYDDFMHQVHKQTNELDSINTSPHPSIDHCIIILKSCLGILGWWWLFMFTYMQIRVEWVLSHTMSPLASAYLVGNNYMLFVPCTAYYFGRSVNSICYGGRAEKSKPNFNKVQRHKNRNKYETTLSYPRCNTVCKGQPCWWMIMNMEIGCDLYVGCLPKDKHWLMEEPRLGLFDDSYTLKCGFW